MMLGQVVVVSKFFSKSFLLSHRTNNNNSTITNILLSSSYRCISSSSSSSYKFQICSNNNTYNNNNNNGCIINNSNYQQKIQYRTKATTTHHRVWDQEAIIDLFDQYAKSRIINNESVQCLSCDDIRELLKGIGEPIAENDGKYTINKLFNVADKDNNGYIDLNEFIEHSYTFLGDNPARIILVVGGPGSGKGELSKRLEQECGVVHLSSGDLLRQEVTQNTTLGKTVKDIMNRGELISSAIIVTLMKKRMKDHPGKRVLLDGFPRSIENAYDLMSICGKPELALHLVCDDTILIERIMSRSQNSVIKRDDDNFQSALHRIRTYHKYHHMTLDWLREQHVPIVNLDCSGTPDTVWNQLVAIGKLMRPAVKIPSQLFTTTTTNNNNNNNNNETITTITTINNEK